MKISLLTFINKHLLFFVCGIAVAQKSISFSASTYEVCEMEDNDSLLQTEFKVVS